MGNAQWKAVVIGRAVAADRRKAPIGTHGGGGPVGLGGLLAVGCMGPALHAPLARARRAAVPMQVQVRGWEPRAGLPFAGPGVGCGPSGHHIFTGMLVPRKR